MNTIGLASLASPTPPLSAADGAWQERSFQRFSRGGAALLPAIEGLLSDAGFPGCSIEPVRYGYFRKVIARIRLTDDRTAFAKIALHPYSVALLEQEERGIAAARQAARQHVTLPDYDLRRLGKDTAVAVMTPLPGRHAAALSTVRSPSGPFQWAGRSQPSPSYLDSLFSGMPQGDERISMHRAIERLVDQAGAIRLPVAPAHGDFVYWNILRRARGAISALDFENFRESAIAGYDAFYWYIVPLTRFAVRRPVAAASLRAIGSLAGFVWQRHVVARAGAPTHELGPPRMAHLALALMLAEHAGQMLREHRMEDIGALIGGDALDLRCRQIALYVRAVEHLAR